MDLSYKQFLTEKDNKHFIAIISILSWIIFDNNKIGTATVKRKKQRANSVHNASENIFLH